jgi:hypothetical protein
VKKIILFALVFVSTSFARAEFQLQLMRRIAVFPIAESNSSMAEDAWWQMRELLTKDQKFLIASKRFMINRGVFQPRKNLKPADAIILGKILDAQALVSCWVEERKLKMKVFEGETGATLWESEAEFHPAISIQDQLIKLSLRLMNDFIYSLPYQAYQIIDDVIGKPVYDRDAKKFAQVFLGLNHKIEVGDLAQWLVVTGDSTQTILNSAPKITVIAEGTVTKIMNDRAEIAIQKMRVLAELKESSLVRFPKELSRLKDMYSGASDERVSSLSNEYLSSEIRNVSETNHETHPTVTALAFIVNIAGLILLAF